MNAGTYGAGDYGRLLRHRGRHPLELIEKLVNKSTLSTQRASHTHVIDIGGKVLDLYDDDNENEYQRRLREALNDAEAKAQQRLREALQKLTDQLIAEKRKALANQKLHFEAVAKRVAEQRDRLEAERIKALTKLKDEEREEALRLAWEEAERQKLEAIRLAEEALTKELNRKHALDKEKGIADALRIAREKFRIRLEEQIAATTRECERIAADEAARVAQLHSEEIERHTIRYDTLKAKYDAEHAHRQRVEEDFLMLQTDYSRFMDYTDQTYHSDYMMKLRRHGMKLSEKRMSDVSEYQEKQIKDIVLPSQRQKRK